MATASHANCLRESRDLSVHFAICCNSSDCLAFPFPLLCMLSLRRFFHRCTTSPATRRCTWRRCTAPSCAFCTSSPSAGRLWIISFRPLVLVFCGECNLNTPFNKRWGWKASSVRVGPGTWTGFKLANWLYEGQNCLPQPVK